MAVPEDYEALELLVRNYQRSLLGTNPNSFKTVLGLSLDLKQQKILEEVVGWQVTNIGINQWNLDDPSHIRSDLIVACNVFHYSPSPTLWLNHVLMNCKQFWMQDLFCRRRSAVGELGDDGDKIRYGYNGATVAHHITFDLGIFQDRLLDYRCYDAGSFRSGRTCINFTAVFRGDLA